jgi:RNA methyltransferase, TrmH family
MSGIFTLSRQRISDLAKLKQKKYRLEQKLVVVEGARLIKQLAIYGILPRELYYANKLEPALAGIPLYELTSAQMSRICSSDHPADIAGLYRLPEPKPFEYRRALYLDGISDPGNLGTIFRTAAAFGIDSILLAEDSCEISNPKVIRASLGAVYKVAHRYIGARDLAAENVRVLALDMSGTKSLAEYKPSSGREIYILGSEAHGIDKALLASADETIRIAMVGEMESLNLAVSAAILCYQLSRQNL